MKIVLKAYSSNGDFTGDCDYGIVDLTKEYAEKLLQRIERANRIRKDDPSFNGVKYWDCSCEYFKHCDEYDAAKDENGKDLGKVVEVKGLAGTDFTPPESACARSECNQSFVSDTGVWWSCYPKHVEGVSIDTATVYLDVIEKAARRKIATEAVGTSS